MQDHSEDTPVFFLQLQAFAATVVMQQSASRQEFFENFARQHAAANQLWPCLASRLSVHSCRKYLGWPERGNVSVALKSLRIQAPPVPSAAASGSPGQRDALCKTGGTSPLPEPQRWLPGTAGCSR